MSIVSHRFRGATFQMQELQVQHKDQETSDAAVQYIARNRSLQHLNLTSSIISGPQIIEILRGTQVSSLSIEFYSETGRTVDFGCLKLEDEPLQLSVLRLNDVPVNGTAQLLSKCPDLSCLEVVRCEDFADGDVDGIVAAMLHEPNSAGASTAAAGAGGASRTKELSAGQHLTRLVLSHLVRVHDRGLGVLAKALPHGRLRHLSLAGCRTITHSGIQQVVSSCGRLISLDLSSIGTLQDAQTADIVLQQTSLRELALPPAAADITFRAMAQVSTADGSFGRLATLQPRQCVGVQSPTGLLELQALLRALPSLKRLEVTWAPGLNDFGVQDITTASPGLRELVLDKCRRVSDRGALHALKSIPNLRLLSLRGTGATDAVRAAAKRYAAGSAQQTSPPPPLVSPSPGCGCVVIL